MSKSTPITVTLELDRETKNTGRYIERDSNGNAVEDGALLGTIYVPKATLEAIRGDSVMPASVTVTVSA